MSILLLLAACSPFEGTWLAQSDLNIPYDGDCEDAHDDDPEYQGTSDGWFDIYATGGGAYVVQWGQSLTGEATGSNLVATWQYVVETDDQLYGQQIEFDADLSGAELSGDVTVTEIYDGDKDYECAYQVSFTAVRTTTGPNTIAGN